MTDRKAPLSGADPGADAVHDRRGAARLLRGLLAVCVVAPPLLFLAATWRNHEQQIGVAEAQANATANMLREHALRVLDTHVLALKQIAERTRGMSLEEMRDSRELHRYLADLSRDLGSPNALWITDAEGKARAGSIAFPAPEVDVSDRDYFLEQKDRDAGIFISVPYRRREGTESWAFGISLRRTASDGSFGGILHVSLDTTFFSDFWETAGPVAEHLVPLMRDDGEMLVRYPAEPGQRLRLPPDSPFPRAVARNPNGLYTAVSRVDGIERINAYRRVGPYPLTISYSFATNAVLGPWWRGIAVYGALAFLTWIGLIAATWQALRYTRRAAAAYDELRAETLRRDLAEAALRRAQRFEAMGQLTGGVAHDFNNLLQVIYGGLRLLSRPPKPDGSDEAAREKVMESLNGAVQRGQALTRHLLSFARRQTVTPSVTWLKAEFERLEPLLAQVLRGRMGLTVAVESDGPVRVDLGELELALLNLVVNARDAMEEGGRVAVTVRDARRPPAEGAEAEPFVAVAVTDTGSGIPRELLDAVFEPFFTTKAEGKGSGLGLSQVYGFARQAGGHVTIDSEVGRGTTVTIHLPRAEAPPDGPRTLPEQPAAPPAAPLRILLVEDNAEISSMTAAVLRHQGHTVETAPEGTAALERLDGGAGFDLVFSDIMMPGGLDGLELARRVRADRPDLPVLLATGFSDRARDAAAEGFRILRKPYDYGELDRVLRELAAGMRAVPGA
ncbi:ATP-binding protein [Azospirillum sp. SYSU D00513]|uniref:ATP-binding protein n=1 Tax=Azospirillum sp. SYSU D00513 TaxID=2812561 RepID=UPI001A960CD1|nr:ATP-binding protein [Azospirillum sp. SYSU D00513]